MQKLFENWRSYINEDEQEDLDRARQLSKDYSTVEKDPDWSDVASAAFLKEMAYDKSYALHVRAYAKYLAHDVNVLTENFLTEEEKKELIKFILLADAHQGRSSERGRKRRRKKGSGWDQTSQDFTPPRGPMQTGGPLASDNKIIIGYPDYNMSAKGMKAPGSGRDLSHSQQSLTAGAYYEQFEKFLGQFIAVWDGEDTITISDLYDFSGRKHKSLLKQIAVALRGAMKNMSAYRFIRTMSPHPEMGTPYKVKLTLTGVKDMISKTVRKDKIFTGKLKLKRGRPPLSARAKKRRQLKLKRSKK